MKKRTLYLAALVGVIFFSTPGLQAQMVAHPSQAKVAIFYIDGLRPDTVDEMVQEGKLPNIKKLFYDQGLRFKHFFTLFPSNTVLANGMLMTGKWPENSGIKTQALFQRFRVRKRNFFLRWKKQRFPKYFNLLTETDIAPRILKENKIRAFYNYLGDQYHSAVSPINSSVAPTAWPHVAANMVDHPYFVTSEAADKIDEINGTYALKYMANDRRGRAFLIWFPGMDEEQHRNEWGQYGNARHMIEDVDVWIGKIYQTMLENNKDERIYTMLFSDHGAIGGKNGIYNQPYYLGRNFFYKELKMNVRGPDFSITHPGSDSEAYVFIDNMGRGQCELYFPVQDIFSGNWNRPNKFYELEHYGRGPNRQPVNLIKAIGEINLEKRNVFPNDINPHPAQFIIVKVSQDLIYVRNTDGTTALIWIKQKDGKYLYRYMPVNQFDEDENGKISYAETAQADPFNYLQDLEGSRESIQKFLGEYHDDKEWLGATYKTHYPDAIFALVKPFHWNQKLSAFAKSQDPDIVVSAMPGWNFRIENVNGADHGYLSEGSLRATLMISGPDIKKGVVETPHRMVELTPTVFQIIGYQGKTDFDEKPIQDIYER